MTDQAVVLANLDGSNIKRVTSAASTNATLVDANPTNIHGYEFYNAAAYAVFVKVFNKATAPVPGTDIPVMVVGVPAGGRAYASYEKAKRLDTGFGYTITKLIGDADVTVVAAADVEGSFFYA